MQPQIVTIKQPTPEQGKPPQSTHFNRCADCVRLDNSSLSRELTPSNSQKAYKGSAFYFGSHTLHNTQAACLRHCTVQHFW